MSLHKNKKNHANTAFYLKYYVILIFAIPLAILVIGYFTAIKSVYGDYLVSSQTAEEQKNNIDAIINQLVDLKKTAASYEKISISDREKINYILPDHIDEPSLYMNIVGLTTYNNTNFVLKDVLVEPFEEQSIKKRNLVAEAAAAAGAGNILKKARINVSLGNVSYIDLKKLLKNIETNIRLFDLSLFEYNPLSAELRLVVIGYYLE